MSRRKRGVWQQRSPQSSPLCKRQACNILSNETLKLHLSGQGVMRSPLIELLYVSFQPSIKSGIRNVHINLIWCCCGPVVGVCAVLRKSTCMGHVLVRGSLLVQPLTFCLSGRTMIFPDTPNLSGVAISESHLIFSKSVLIHLKCSFWHHLILVTVFLEHGSR